MRLVPSDREWGKGDYASGHTLLPPILSALLAKKQSEQYHKLCFKLVQPKKLFKVHPVAEVR